MIERKRLTLAMLMKNLLMRLLDAREKKDQTTLAELETAFEVLVEASYESEDVRAISFLDSLYDAARDAITGVDWKSDLPSVDSVDSIFSS